VGGEASSRGGRIRAIVAQPLSCTCTSTPLPQFEASSAVGVGPDV
jgi:hypothetical protein